MRIFRDDWVLDASYGEYGLSGTVRRKDGVDIPFTAVRADDRSRADIYVAGAIGDCSTGAVVLDDDPMGEPEIVGTYCAGGIYGQVTPIKAMEWGAEWFEMHASTPVGDVPVMLERIRFGDLNEDPGP